MRAEHADTPVARVIEEDGVAAAIGKKHVASVLYTYRCTLTCRHCLFSCSPSKPDVHVGLEDGLEYLRCLHGLDRVVHIAGGEAMMYYDEMLELCRVAAGEGVAPHFIETNATWAASADIARRRLGELQEAGVLGLLISACPHHQAECPPERYRHCYEAAVKVFGERNVAAGDHPMEHLEDLVAISRDETRLGEYVRKHPPRLVGRAGEVLARFLPGRPIEELAADNAWHGPIGGMACGKEFGLETMWEVHIDPYGNVQTCCGIVLGNAKRTSLAEAMDPDTWRRGPVVDAVYREGPVGLLKLAVERGYEPRAEYPQRCGMCWEIRKFLRPYFPESLGPEEVYAVD
jgi:hypothetical protein